MKKRILCFGDSNTWGAIPGDADRYPNEVRWTGIMAAELGDAYEVINEGYNGRTTVFDDAVEGRLSGIAYFGPCLDTNSPLDLVIIALGTNDLKVRFGVDARTIAFGFNRYLDSLRITPMMGEKPKVLLVSPTLIDPSYKENALFHDMFGENACERSKGLAGAYREFAAGAGIAFFDAAQVAQADEADGVHMAAPSHEKLGRALANKVRELIG